MGGGLTATLAGFAASLPRASIPERVRCVRDPVLEAAWGGKIGEAEVRVQARDGATRKARALPPGEPRRPLSEADQLAKIKDCLAWGGAAPGTSGLTRCVTAMRHSRTVIDLSGLLRLPAVRQG